MKNLTKISFIFVLFSFLDLQLISQNAIAYS